MKQELDSSSALAVLGRLLDQAAEKLKCRTLFSGLRFADD